MSGTSRIDSLTKDYLPANLCKNKENCLYPASRLCMDNYPMDGIDLTIDPPVIAKLCMGCGYFCENICPTNAIYLESYRGEPSPPRERPGQGHIWELGVPAIKEDEEKGLFRRLVPVEKWGWDTPRYIVFNNHPRWIIGKGYGEGYKA